MRNILNGIAILLLLVVSASANDYRTGEYCDYYDFLGSFVLSFKKEIPLGPSGPSNSSGIKFLFPDKSTLLIYGNTSLDDPGDVLSGSEQLYPEIANFIKEYAKQGCQVRMIPGHIGRKVTCGEYEYSILLFQEGSTMFSTHILYDHSGKKFFPEYENIVKSMFYFRGEKAAAKARKVVSNLEWPNYNMDDPYAQPRIYCGKGRIRHMLLDDAGQ